jgi:hypothetical protein
MSLWDWISNPVVEPNLHIKNIQLNFQEINKELIKRLKKNNRSIPVI